MKSFKSKPSFWINPKWEFTVSFRTFNKHIAHNLIWTLRTHLLKLHEINQNPSYEKMGLIQTYDLSSRLTSSDPGISSTRTVSGEMGSCFWAFMTLSMSLSLVRTTLVTSTAREMLIISTYQYILCEYVRERERESTGGGAEGPDPEDFQAGTRFSWHCAMIVTKLTNAGIENASRNVGVRGASYRARQLLGGGRAEHTTRHTLLGFYQSLFGFRQASVSSNWTCKAQYNQIILSFTLFQFFFFFFPTN